MTTDDIYRPRSEFREIEVKPVVSTADYDSNDALRDVLYEVLRRFPEARAAIVRAMTERVEVMNARRKNNGDG